MYLTDKRTSQRFPLVSLGLSGAASFDTELGPGQYDVTFEGKLMDDPYFTGSYPRTTQSTTLATNLSVTNNLLRDFDIPAKRVTATLNVNGQPYDEGGASGNYITVRRQGTYDDIPVIHFNDAYTQATNVFSVLPGTYDVRYAGSNLTGKYINIMLNEELAVTQDRTVDLNVVFRTIRISVIDPSAGQDPAPACGRGRVFRCGNQCH